MPRTTRLTSIAFATLAAAGLSLGQAAAETKSPPGAKAYIISPKSGTTIKSPFKVQFGLTGMGVAPAGVEKEKTGHHHLIIDTKLSAEALKAPLPADEKKRSFRRRPDRDNGDAAARQAHIAARFRRLDAHSAQPAGDVGSRHHNGGKIAAGAIAPGAAFCRGGGRA